MSTISERLQENSGGLGHRIALQVKKVVEMRHSWPADERVGFDLFHEIADVGSAEVRDATVTIDALMEALRPFAEFGHERDYVWEEDFAKARRAALAMARKER